VTEGSHLVANLSLRITAAPASEPGRTPTTAKASEVSEDGCSERAKAFESHEHFIALSLIEADRANRATPSSAAELSLLSVLRCREPTTADWVRALFPCIQ